MKKYFAFFTASLLLFSCTPSMQERELVVLKRASYDLGCDKKDIKITHLQTDRVMGFENSVKFGAEGCGKKFVYDNIDDKVYIEGAVPNAVIIQSGTNTYKPASVYSAPYKGYGGVFK